MSIPNDVGAYIVIDMINDFIHPNGVLCVLPENEIGSYSSNEEYINPLWCPIRDNIKGKIEYGLKNNKKIIFVSDSHDKNDKEFNMFTPHAIKGTWGAKIIDELNIFEKSANIFHKKTFDVFSNWQFENYIEDGIPMGMALMFAGVCTDICILASVISAVCRGYKCYIDPNDVAALNNNYPVLQLLETNFGVTIL